MPTTGSGKKIRLDLLFPTYLGKTSWQNKKPVRKLQHFIYCEPETHPFHISDGINCFMFLQ